MDAEWSSISAQMRGSFLEQQIRRANRNLLLLGLLCVAGVAIYGVAQWRYFYNFFAGPFAATADSLSAIQHPGDQPRYFVKVAGDQSSDTGLQEVEREEGSAPGQNETVKAEYSVLALGDRLLVVKRNLGDKGTVFQGALGELPTAVREQIITPVFKDHPEANQAFFPFLLDATSFRSDGYIALAICIPVVGLGAWLILLARRRTNTPTQDPIVKSISRYGSLVDTAQKFDLELRGNTLKFGKAILTTSWVILPSAFGLAVCHIPDLVWAYKKVTKHRTNFIPTGKTYALIMYDRYGKPLQAAAKQKKVDEMLAVLVERAPWAIFGYSDELNKALKTNWRGIVATADARRPGARSASPVSK
jgi:hypothetical protein